MTLATLNNRRILLGVTGSIAAYKAAEVCSGLVKLGADVHAVLTQSALKFIGEATFRALTRNPVLVDVFDEPLAQRIAHIDLAQSVDLVLVAPASADFLAKMAHGLADDFLSTALLAVPSTTPVLVAPAMNTKMWEHPATQANLATLRHREVQIIQPAVGLLACQDVGIGKLAEVETIVREVVDRLLCKQDFAGKVALVTSGATREPLDPVRFLTNRSSGKMGFAIASALAQRGAKVVCVTGSTSAPFPDGVERVQVETAEQMFDACRERFAGCDLFVAAAAVSDFTPEQVAEQKIKKEVGCETLTLTLRRTPDILATLAKQKRVGQVVVGFAAETEDLINNAKRKLEAKHLDLIVANDVRREDAGFNVDTNVVTMLYADGRSVALPLMTKREVAEHLLDGVVSLFDAE